MNFQPTRKNKYVQSFEQNFKNLPYIGALKNSSVNELQHQTSRSNMSFGPKQLMQYNNSSLSLSLNEQNPQIHSNITKINSTFQKLYAPIQNTDKKQ